MKNKHKSFLPLVNFKFIKIIVILLMFFLFLISCSEITAPEDFDSPSTPANFVLIGGGDGQAHFRWVKNSEPDFDKYVVFRSVQNTESFEEIAKIRDSEYLDRFLSYNLVYYYYIIAVDYIGNKSEPTAVIDVRPVNISSPPSPNNIIVFGHNYPNFNQIEFAISWTPPNISDLWKFRIYRGSDANFDANNSSLYDSTAVSIYFDRAVNPGDRYFYRIQSIDLGQKFSSTSTATGDLILQNAELISPTNQIEFSSPYQFTWKEVENAINYQVFVGRAQLSDIIWTSAKITDKQTTYSGPQLKSGQIYYWWIGAFSKEDFFIDNVKINPDVNSRSEIRSFFVR